METESETEYKWSYERCGVLVKPISLVAFSVPMEGA